MKLIFLGTELDTSKEHELFSKNKFGFNATVTHNKNSEYNASSDDVLVHTYHNCTEIHFKFPRLSRYKDSCAFESDIHNTGGHTEIHNLEQIEITLATKKHSKF